MKRIYTLLVLSLLLTACTRAEIYYGFKYNPVYTLENLKKYSQGELNSDSFLIFKNRATCFYDNDKGQAFLISKLKGKIDNLEVKGDLSKNKSQYYLKIYDNKTLEDIAEIKMTCTRNQTEGHFCSISQLRFLQGQEYPDLPICY